MRTAGIDLGIHKISMALVEDEELVLSVTHVAPKGMTRGQELMFLASWASSWFIQHRFEQAWIEDTLIGNNRKFSMALTEVLGAVEAALSVHWTEGLRVERVNNKTWKRDVVGNGNADKLSVRDWVTQEFPVYAVTCGDDQDRLDAGCIALYGAAIRARAAGLTLA